jgi:DNA-binding CsgD family transcriptional regulator
MSDLKYLSKREREVLAFMCDGLDNDAIAEKLGISIFTVKNNVASLRRVIKARNRAEAVSIAFKSGEMNFAAREITRRINRINRLRESDGPPDAV